jgi:molybdopterin-guanine dinucleotide biosynthesis protein A
MVGETKLEALYKNTGAIVLAGGRSTRMGTDKAGLIFGRDTLLNHVLVVASHVASRIIVILNRDQRNPVVLPPAGCQIIIGRDSKDRQGPMQGIVDGVSLLPDDIQACYVLSCDLPFLTSDWLQKLREQMNQSVDVVCTCNENIANPLLAIYRWETLLSASRLLNQNQFRPIRLWDGKNVIRLVPPHDSVNPGTDVNTRRELLNALKIKGA